MMRLDFWLLAFGFSFVLQQICNLLVIAEFSSVFVWSFLVVASIAVGASIAWLIG